MRIHALGKLRGWDERSGFFYQKLTDNLNLQHCSSFLPEHVRDSIPYSQASRYERICSDTVDCNRHLKIQKASRIGTGYNTLDFRQFRRATRIFRNEMFRRPENVDSTDRVHLIFPYFPGAEHLCSMIGFVQLPVVGSSL